MPIPELLENSGIAVVTSGPGLTNALTGIAEARLDSSPLVVLVSASGEVPGKTFQLHQIQQDAVVEQLVKGCFKPATAEEVPQAVLRAAELACQGEPGPTLVETCLNSVDRTEPVDINQAAFAFTLPKTLAGNLMRRRINCGILLLLEFTQVLAR